MVTCLSNKVYTPWGKQYSSMNWREDWNIFIRLAEKEVTSKSFKETKSINHIIYWFDTEILQKIHVDKKVTLDVRIRIVWGMVNKISYQTMSRELKQNFMECIWDAYQKFSKDYIDYHCRYILELPF